MKEDKINEEDLEKAVWMNTREAAAYLRVTPQALRNHIYRGDVPFYKFRKNLRFKRSELDRLIEGTRMGGRR